MLTTELSSTLVRLFGELVNGAPQGGDAFVLNSGDAGLLRSLDKLSATDASQSVNDGATIAAHARHLQYGLSLMNRWAREGGTPLPTRLGRGMEDFACRRGGMADDSRGPGPTRRVAGWSRSVQRVRSRPRAHRDDRKHRASRISPRRDQTDRQGRTRSEGRHVQLTPYSSRSAVTGSTRVARRAGM